MSADYPTNLNRARMAAYLNLDRDAAHCRELATKCDTYGAPHRCVGFIERGLEMHEVRAELLREAPAAPKPADAPFPLLLVDPGLSLVDYRDLDDALARIEARDSSQ